MLFRPLSMYFLKEKTPGFYLSKMKSAPKLLPLKALFVVHCHDG